MRRFINIQKYQRSCNNCFWYNSNFKSCNLFKRINKNNSITHIPVNISRKNEKLCGYNGNYFKVKYNNKEINQWDLLEYIAVGIWGINIGIWSTMYLYRV